MNHKTRKLARALYDAWLEDVLCIAPSESHIQSYAEAERSFLLKAVFIKKRLDFRNGDHDLSEATQ